LLGVIGYPIGHTASPAMVNAALRHAGVEGILYIPVEVRPRDLKAFCSSAPLMNFLGFNVTIPHKITIIKHLSELKTSAKEVEAVNVVKIRGGKLVGYNTDVAGVMAVIPSQQEVDGNVVVLGVGGAARAAAIALKKRGFRDVVFVGRRASTLKVFKKFAERKKVGCRFVKFGSMELADIMRETELLINATPVGMYPNTNSTPIPGKLLHSDMTVFDMVYNPVETKLLKTAKARGAKTINGVRMLVAQGAEALKIWLGIEADQRVMEKAVIEALEGFGK